MKSHITLLASLGASFSSMASYTITSGDGTDITDVILKKRSAHCRDYVGQYTATARDINERLTKNAYLTISVDGDKCSFQSNAIPNHAYNDGDRSFPNQVTAQNQKFQVTTNPKFAPSPTPISLRTDNAVFLNGVKVDLLAAGCYGVGNGKIGCFNMDQKWRYDPAATYSDFKTDSHNAHAQPDGTYHYHATPNALFVNNNSQVSPVIGFAADGFPIYGPYFQNNSLIREAKSSYQLKKGVRPSGSGNPGGQYDGTYRDDYVFVSGSGDLDECNGMTLNGQYGYYVTSGYPYVINCFKGTPDPSFNKASPGHHSHERPGPRRKPGRKGPPPPPRGSQWN
ncbi:YHYH protein [Vibrio sp. S4M6]|uniref:YHYH protein n=1 Tax=Vibrio sinus TaxID=2946865 RepID=UPI002029ED98|nr:YHYH protein [Vibrio sinus]MCL9782897.1 YHYH protein [Vibrio sinus]